MLAVGYHCDMLNWMCAVVNLLLLLYFVVLLQYYSLAVGDRKGK